MSVKELKEALRLNSTHFLNVYFASSVQEELAGAATWPWDKDALSHLGKLASIGLGSFCLIHCEGTFKQRTHRLNIFLVHQINIEAYT